MKMMIRKTLNGQAPHTTKDAARDPYDWWETPQAQDKLIFSERRANRVMLVMCVIVAGLIFAGVM